MSVESGGNDPPKLDQPGKNNNAAMEQGITFEQVLGEMVPKPNSKKRSLTSSSAYSKVNYIKKADLLEYRESMKRKNLERLCQNKFSREDKGPFFVHVEGKNRNIGKAHPMLFGKWLLKNEELQANDILDIRVTGKNRVKITTSTAEVANQLTECASLKSEDLTTYVPLFLTKKTGIIRGVSLNLNEEEILDNMKSIITPESIERFKKFEFEGDNVKVSLLETCKITFYGQQIPEYVTIYGGFCKVHPYIPPVRQCGNCLRYNHATVQCRGKQRCLRCGEEHILKDCPNTETEPTCVHCSGKHLSNSKACEVYQQFSEANRKKFSETSFASAMSYDLFPKLNNVNNTSKQGLETPKVDGPQIQRRQFRRVRKTSATKNLVIGSSWSEECAQPANTNPIEPITSNPHATSHVQKCAYMLNQVIEQINNPSTSQIEHVDPGLHNLAHYNTRLRTHKQKHSEMETT